ncbi:MAG: type II secretion system F family protein [Clostridia bacterium]|nr:type II secretion system F family protein [Clostridia bacterium]
MKTYRYRGLTSGGAEVEGVVEAFNEKDAVTKARENCRIITEVSPVSAGKMDEGMNRDIGVLLSGGRIEPKELSVLCSQLAIELKAGLPLVRSLELTGENEEDKRVKRMLKEVAEDVHSGVSLADSFESRGSFLPRTFIETVRAGESSGKLDECFEHLKVYYEDSAAVSSKVRGALIYPVMLIAVAVVVVAIIMIKAVPVFEKSFASLGNELPGVTKFLISSSHFFQKYYLVIIAIIAIIAIGLRVFGKTDKGKHIFGTIALLFPGIGLVNKMNACCQFASTMNIMLSAGLPLTEATRITGAVIDNVMIKDDINKAVDGVIEGKRLGDGLRESKWLASMLVEMTAVGEETGNMTDTLEVVNDYYKKEVAASVTTALGIMEPCITVVMALLVVFILLSVYLPLFTMYGTV